MYTNSHIIHTKSFQNGVVSYPDKFSYRSQVKRKNDYLVRLYWHFQQYIDQKGWVYFDTLTYDDAHLPHVCDYASFPENFSCFRSEDVKLFLDRLHSRLSYYKKGTFTHFVCSEYGHDDVYVDSYGRQRKGTKRPHYHILLFFDNNDIDRVWLADQVHDCWQCGRTDNFGSFAGERSRSYVLHNCFENTIPLDRLLRVTHYVSKYVLKDVQFSQKVDRLVKQYCRKNYKQLVTVSDKKAFVHDCNQLRSRLSEFIMLSNGFGKYAIDAHKLDASLIYDKFAVVIPDKDKIKKYYKLPEYYERKLFYKCENGRWLLNEHGKLFYSRKLEVQSKNYADFLQDVSVNMCDEDREKLLTLLSGRSFSQLADYVIYYRGRICNPASIDCLPSKQYVVDHYVTLEDDPDVVENDPIPKIDYRRCLEPRWRWIIEDDPDTPIMQYLAIEDVLKHRVQVEDWKQYIIDDSWFPEHYDFDECLKLVFDYTSRVELSRQQLYDDKSYLNQQFSLFGLKTDF